MVWTQEESDCSSTVSQIYLWPAKVYEFIGDSREEGLNLLGNSIIILDDEVGTQDKSEDIRCIAGLILWYPEDICSRRCYITQVEDLALCLRRDSKKLEPIMWKSGFPLELVTQQTRLGHAHLQTNLRMYDRFALIQQDPCKVERQVLENATNTLVGSNNRYALNSLLGPGHRVTTVGTTAYVT